MHNSTQRRVFSAMRPTGSLHLGHLGILKQWISLQRQYECYFATADFHALTTHYQHPEIIKQARLEMVIDWLAVGIDPHSAHIFYQSDLLETANLNLLLSMSTPLGWLERVPTYKEQLQNLKDKEIDTYGFLGYPLLQTADILILQATDVPIGEDQTPHIELAREIARRFNYLYGRELDYEKRAETAMEKLGDKNKSLYQKFRKQYQEFGDKEALTMGQALIQSIHHINISDRERLLGYLEGFGKIILPPPQGLIIENSTITGLDGRKMSKSYHNTITLRDPPEMIAEKINKMPTDPARVRRSDPGDPEKCPVWLLHKTYSTPETQTWVNSGCRSAGIGCLECKKPVIDTLCSELKPIQERRENFSQNQTWVHRIIEEGCEAAKSIAKDTLEKVKQIIGLVD